MPELITVSPGETITDDHTNDIMRRTLQRYDDKAIRTSENASPEAGDLAYMQDSGSVLLYHGAAWHRLLPLATVLPYAGTSTPPTFLFCHGQAVSRTTYADLFAEIGTTYGAGDGSTTFNLPDLRQKFVLGKAASGTGATLGGTGGSIDHKHTNPTTGSSGSHAHTQGSTGSAGSHAHTLGAGWAQIALYDSEVKLRRRDLTGSDRYSMNFKSDSVGFNVVSALTDTATYLGGSTDSESSHSHTNPNTASGGSHTHSQGDTGTQNPPFVVLNHIIKAL